MIVNVKIDRIALTAARDAADVGALRAALERAIGQQLARSAEPRGSDPAALARATRAAAADVANRCR